MKVLELFAGSRSIGKVCDELGLQCFSIDIEQFDKIDLAKDILEVTPADIPFIPDMVWASPLCTTYSIAAISHHRDGQLPKTELARISDNLIMKTLELIKHYQEINPALVWYMENPVGMLRKMSFMQGLDRRTVTYCQYGDERMKPTDIWSNNFYSIFNLNGWQPKEPCKNGQPCHVSAPRGSRTGTQGLKNSYERSKIPHALCREVVEASLLKYKLAA